MWPVRKWRVGEAAPHAHHVVAVHVEWIKFRKRTWTRTTVVPGNYGYVTVHDPGGSCLYDSRNDVPCDMDAWNDYADRHYRRRGPAIRHLSAGGDR